MIAAARVGVVALGVVAAILVLSKPSLVAAGRVVTFRGLGGRTVSGLFLEAHDPPAPAVVLVPMLGRTRDDWQAVGQRLTEANISALAIDLPGNALPGDPAELTGWHEDVGAAVNYLAERPAEVRSGAIGVLGASLGANLAVVAAAMNPSVKSIGLVSPSLDYRGVRIEAPLAQYGARPALLMASVHDPYAARSVRTLQQDASGIREVRWSNVVGHGDVLLSRDPDLVRSLVEWFRLTLGVN